MNQPSLGIVVIAAGKGTRMRSALPKELHPLCGRSLIGHVLALADALQGVYTVVVLSPEKLAPVRAHGGSRYQYSVQAKQLGTGHAVSQARAALPAVSDDVLVLYGDTPLLRPETARALVELRRARGALLALMSFDAQPPTGYGRVVRNAAGDLIELVEERNATPAQLVISEVNSGIMCCDAAWMWSALDRIPLNSAKGEYYLTDLVAMAVAERGAGAAVALPCDDMREALGINDRAQLAQAETILRERILLELMYSGVTITDPLNTYVDSGVTVGNDTTLLPGTMLRGTTKIGANCEIGPATTIIDSSIGAGAQVRYALIEQATLPAAALIGPFAHVIGEEHIIR